MLKTLNLCEILRGHEGEAFYNAISGSYIKLKSINGGIVFSGTSFNEDGSYIKGGECMLFPSKDQRDWNKWDKENNKKTPIEKSALALLKIHQLIEVGYGGNVIKDEFFDERVMKYVINLDKEGRFHIYKGINIMNTHIAFHTEEQAEEFLKYPENVQLLRDYFQIN